MEKCRNISSIFSKRNITFDIWNAKLLISNGTGFSNTPISSSANLQGDYTNLYVGDFNGDGKSDLLRQETGKFDNDANNNGRTVTVLGTRTRQQSPRPPRRRPPRIVVGSCSTSTKK